jgi:hypothetical protein
VPHLDGGEDEVGLLRQIPNFGIWVQPEHLWRFDWQLLFDVPATIDYTNPFLSFELICT